jgi:hypothetical protein
MFPEAAKAAVRVTDAGLQSQVNTLLAVTAFEQDNLPGETVDGSMMRRHAAAGAGSPHGAPAHTCMRRLPAAAGAVRAGL